MKSFSQYWHACWRLFGDGFSPFLEDDLAKESNANLEVSPGESEDDEDDDDKDDDGDNNKRECSAAEDSLEFRP